MHSSKTQLREPSNGVSVVIPNWNHELLLGRSVGSALKAVGQLRAAGVPAEVLVVDDASRDGSVTLLRQLEALYAEAGLRVILKPENSGMPAVARNQALRWANYRYVLFLDADNEVIPENVLLFYRSIVATQAALVYGNIFVVTSPCTPPERLVSHESFQDKILEANYIDTMAFLDRAQVADLGGLLADSRVIGREDWELNLHLAMNGRLVVYVPVVIGYYYTVELSTIDEHKDDRSHLRFLKRAFNQLNLRQGHLLRTRHRRYHPDLGYI